MTVQIDVESYINSWRYKRHVFDFIGIDVDEVIDVLEDMNFDVVRITDEIVEADLVVGNIVVRVDGQRSADCDDAIIIINANKWIVSAVLYRVINEAIWRWDAEKSIKD